MEEEIKEILLRYQNPVVTKNGSPFIEETGISVTLDHNETAKQLTQLFISTMETIITGSKREFWEDYDHAVGGYISKKELMEKLTDLKGKE